jgi:hypothetical protein
MLRGVVEHIPLYVSLPRTLSPPTADCAGVGVTGIKPEPPSAVASRGLTPATPTKPGSVSDMLLGSGWPGEPGQRRAAAQCGMWSAGVVVGEPGPHGGGAIGRRLERLGIGPLAQAGLDEPLRLAVGARRVGARALVLDAAFGHQIAKSKAFIGRTTTVRLKAK